MEASRYAGLMNNGCCERGTVLSELHFHIKNTENDTDAHSKCKTGWHRTSYCCFVVDLYSAVCMNKPRVSKTHFVPLLLSHFAITLWKKIHHLLQSCCVSSNLTSSSVWKLFVQRKTKPETATSLFLLLTSSNCNIRWWRSVDRPLHTVAQNTWHIGVEHFSFIIFNSFFPFRPVKPAVLGTVGGQKRAAGQPGIWTTWPWGLALRASFLLPSTLYGCILSNQIRHYFFFPCKEQHHPSF